MATLGLIVRSIAAADRDFVRAELIRNWGSPTIYSLDRPYAADELPGFVAEADATDAPSHRGLVGHITISFEPNRCEIITLAATFDGGGVGTVLLAAATEECRRRGYARVTLTTTNDNLRALAFYQKRGWRIVAVHQGMIDRYRARKPEIPTIGMNGIPLRDEIELELAL